MFSDCTFLDNSIENDNSTYVNWGKDGPDGEDEPNGEDMENYAMFYEDYPLGQWNDGDFGEYSFTVNGGQAFICEWNSEDIAVFPEYEKQNFNNHTYQIIDRGLSWTEAKEYCESIGGHLVTINSQKEQTFLTSIFNKNETMDSYSIGLYYADDEWKWVDDSPVSYTNWNMFENSLGEICYMPDNWEGDEYYGYMFNRTTEFSDWTANKGMWNDSQELVLPFICEWDTILHTPGIEEGLDLKYRSNISKKEETVHFKDKNILNSFVNNTSSTIYQPDLAYLLSILSSSAYNPTIIEENIKSLGFTDYNLENYYKDSTDTEYEPDSCAYSIAKKQIENDKTLVLITIRGTYGKINFKNLSSENSDWRSNFNIENQQLYGYGKHKGFNTAMEKIYLHLKEKLDDDLLNKNTKYVITGHSRGAGVANLLTKKLNDIGVSKYNSFNYNFACPDVSKATPLEWNPSGKYDNIFNICVAGDPVTIIPGVIGNILSNGLPSTKIYSLFAQWGKYGRTRWFSDNWNDVNSDFVFEFHDSENYIKIVKDIKFFSEGKKWSEFKRTEIFNNLLTLIVMCPVDVQIMDNTGNILASIVNNKVEYNTSSDDISIVAWNEDDNKYFIVLGESDLNVSLKGTDEGDMDCIISSISNGKIESESIAFFEDVELYDGKEMFFKVNDENSRRTDILSVVGETYEIINPVYYQAPCVYGDVNEDDSVDSSDASLVLAEYAKIQTGGAGEFTDIQFKAADANNDGVVDASDASKILAYYAMISTGKEPSWD